MRTVTFHTARGITETEFDLLDGCTPAPMFSFEPDELAAAISGADGKRRMSCCRSNQK